MDRSLLFGEVGAKVVSGVSKKQAGRKKTGRFLFWKNKSRVVTFDAVEPHVFNSITLPDARANPTIHRRRAHRRRPGPPGTKQQRRRLVTGPLQPG